MVQTGTFPLGITNDKNEVCREFTLAERAFRHSLEVANDRGIDRERLSDPVYYDAAILSKRLSVAGVKKLTPDMVLDLDGDDGDELAGAMMELDKRRSEFRAEKQKPAQAADSPA